MRFAGKRLLSCAFAVLPLIGNAASAKDCAGVSFPDQVQADGSNLALNGVGLRLATMLKVKVYVAALYVTKASTDPGAILGSSTPYELTLHFVRDVGADDLRKGWEEGFEKNAKGQLGTLKERIATLNGWMTEIKSGQKLTFIHKPGAGLQVNVNGVVKGMINGDDFAKTFLSIWLGDPPNPEVKAGLLGGACGQ